MPNQNAPSRLAVMAQTLMQQLSLVSRFRQFSRGKSAHIGNPWRFQPQQLRLVILALTAIVLSHETVQAQNSPAMGVSPKQLAFAAVEGGDNPGNKTLDIAGENLSWTAS